MAYAFHRTSSKAISASQGLNDPVEPTHILNYRSGGSLSRRGGIGRYLDAAPARE